MTKAEKKIYKVLLIGICLAVAALGFKLLYEDKGPSITRWEGKYKDKQVKIQEERWENGFREIKTRVKDSYVTEGRKFLKRDSTLTSWIRPEYSSRPAPLSTPQKELLEKATEKVKTKKNLIN